MTHGESGSAEYRAWVMMKNRCVNPNYKHWHRYGGRGISVCSLWKYDFAAFLAYIGPRPSPRHSLDRYPNGDGNYEPGNVRWATAKEQADNRPSRNRLVTWRGETKNLTEWAKTLGVSKIALFQRIWRGWDVEKALSEPYKLGTRKDRKAMQARKNSMGKQYGRSDNQPPAA